MDAKWFEMDDVSKRTYQRSPFVPLRQVSKQRNGEYANVGFKEEFYAVTSCAVPVGDQAVAEATGWDDLGLGHTFGGYVHQGRYFPGDEIRLGDEDEVRGVPLVIVSSSAGSAKPEWHLHQDFVVTLSLRQEGDIWVAPDEGYRIVARLTRDEQGQPILLEVAREYLLDYLTARDMGLYLLTFRQRRSVLETEPSFPWPDKKLERVRSIGDMFRGRFYPIHEGSGMQFGEKMAVFHSARTDFDEGDEIPQLGLPNNTNTASSSYVSGFSGKQVWFVDTDRFYNEWIAPSGFSPRIRGDDETPNTFHVDATGTPLPLTSAVTGSWLWFKPDVVDAMLRFRDAKLSWYSQDTGSLAAVPDYALHFGVNALGLLNIYAEDVAALLAWQQRIMAGHSVVPEGGVSQELTASQVHVNPADTVSPEDRLVAAVERLNEVTTRQWGAAVLKLQEGAAEALKGAHRFRALTDESLLTLAKDVTRVVLEKLDLDLMLKHGLPLKKGDNKPKTRAALQRAMATQIGDEAAQTMLGPLAGLYDLRLNDAHEARDKVASGLTLLGIDQARPHVQQGAQLLDRTAQALEEVAQVIETWKALSST